MTSSAAVDINLAGGGFGGDAALDTFAEIMAVAVDPGDFDFTVPQEPLPPGDFGQTEPQDDVWNFTEYDLVDYGLVA